MKKTTLTVLSLLLFSQIAFSKEQKVLTRSNFNKLAQYALTYMNNTPNLQLEQNVSGFLRLRIPLLKGNPLQLDKIRLHLWPGDQEIPVESIHSHPRYFETFLINGGYTHQTFKELKNGDVNFRKFTVTKGPKNKRIAADRGEIRLNHGRQKSINQGEIARISKSLKHRIISRKQNTLSINAVFENRDKSRAYLTYNTYYSIETPEEQMTSKRITLGIKESQQYLDMIRQYLEKFLQRIEEESYIE